MVPSLKEHLKNNLISRFFLAGILNTIFGWLIFSTFIFFDKPVSISLFFGMLFGILFNYITIGGYAFRKFSKFIFIKFLLANLIIYFINLQLLEKIEDIFSSIIIAQFFLLPFMAISSFIIMKKFVFK